MTTRMLIDDLGGEVALPEQVRSVVSLVPSLTEAIAATHPGLLIGATDWCSHPADLDVPRVRGTKNPDTRAIIALAPELVICNQEENRELDVQRLRAAGIAVWVTRIETLAQAFASLRRLFIEVLGGQAPGWLTTAETTWNEPPVVTNLTAVTAIWRDPWMVVGGRTFTNDLLEKLGLRNPFANALERYPHVDPSQIAAAGADLLLLPDEPYLFTETDGPEVFPGLPSVLVSGRSLTWYGPSLVSARAELAALITITRTS
jgi:ABC-type Fe3+-hydroxamate transport system substrate-binding protein